MLDFSAKYDLLGQYARKASIKVPTWQLTESPSCTDSSHSIV